MSKRHTALYSAVGVALVFALFIGVLATRKTADLATAKSPLVGKQAPAFAGADLLDPQRVVSNHTTAGKWLLVNFFATWCVPCQKEQPDLSAFQRKHQQAGDASVVSIKYGEGSLGDVKSFFQQHNSDWPVIDDRDGTMAADWGTRGVPESFLVSPNGYVVAKIIGGVNEAGLEKLLQRVQSGS
jgi:cytochrome c biogenesis protein CcmG/thiol:disulfide interchange protein DsbE